MAINIIIRARDDASSVFSSMGSKVAAVGAVKGAADLEAFTSAQTAQTTL